MRIFVRDQKNPASNFGEAVKQLTQAAIGTFEGNTNYGCDVIEQLQDLFGNAEIAKLSTDYDDPSEPIAIFQTADRIIQAGAV